ncbi:MAG: DEAD/DEAH box helicase family protein [bacterium]|nr:DEAD/DEAH box helicase family protein [bacterium]
MKFHQVIDKYRKIAFSEKDKGDRFERLMQAYLLSDPIYAPKFKNVWLWNEFPARKDFGGKDTGIDLVALTHEGDFWAIQCKCYEENATIDKPEVDSFISTSGRQFSSEEIKTTKFAHRLWISTTNKWGSNAEETIKNQSPPVSRISLYDLEQAPVDWGKLEKGITGDSARTKKYPLKRHQKTAVEETHNAFQTADRGKLIMACGTGKTFTSLKVAENETDGKGLILFLVPSIALLGQTLREWSAQAQEPINAICICSDPKITKKRSKGDDSSNVSVVDLAVPASTNVKHIVQQFQAIQGTAPTGMTVVFSTYQSIDVISKAQKQLLKSDKSAGIFDLIICDEAHRTTGVALSEDDSSAFIKVHQNDFIQARKRLYMTATPRLYSDDSKAKAAKDDVILCSMDDPEIYGEEIYRIGFGEAVENDLLSDYKVLILTLNESDMPAAVQKMVANPESEINADDASKLIGCINALSKQILGDEGILKSSDPEPMKRAVAFCQNIKISKKITKTFNDTTDIYLDSLSSEKRKQMVEVASQHIDGSMSAPERDELMSWLKSSEANSNECRVLTNVRCLSEGVDVPSLDAVMFLSARNSQVDVVQSVGRVMRTSPGKKYGYIIIPVVVPADVEASKALDDNKRYQVVWSVLNALRAHDDRFNATINKIELNKKRPDQIIVGRPDTDSDGEAVPTESNADLKRQLAFQFEELQSVVYARMVNKVGDRKYWEQWAKDVAVIVERQIERITKLSKEEGKHKQAFEDFLSGLQENINPSINQQEAIEMLAQHIITKPVFEALFEGYSFVQNNPISVSMQKMLDLLEAQAIAKDTEVLDKFYQSVRSRAEGIDNAEGKQRIIIELYDKFFKTAFPKMVEKLGIVYTPVEVVDFIIHSVNDVLKKEFGRSVSDENIHILDPFTGTGTFITRLLQSGLITQKDLERKYEKELHANEIVLLAYYIAAVNIENAYHDLLSEGESYKTFEGICLTDTFQLGETDASSQLISEIFPHNSKRVVAQKKAPIRVIMGNPPYSTGQRSANDNAQNQRYEKLDSRIGNTYAKETNATNKNSLYDSFIKAFRWSSDRLDKENGGVICFVSNGSWIDGNAQDGFRKCLEKEFSSIYVFNLRGNARTQGEIRRKEKDNVFGQGTRTTVSITLLVKKPKQKQTKSEIYYHDIGDYLTRDEKLNLVSKFCSVGSPEMTWKRIKPNEQGDWLNQRNELFETYIPMGDKQNKKNNATYFVDFYSNGLKTQRDAWCYNSSKKALEQNMGLSIDFYNSQLQEYESAKSQTPNLNAKDFLSYESAKISWTTALVRDIERGKKHSFDSSAIVEGLYRPFFKQKLYYSRDFNERVYQMPKIFPDSDVDNLLICITGPGGSKGFSALLTDEIPNLHFLDSSQCFPLYYYEPKEKVARTLFDSNAEASHVRRDGITDFILTRAREIYGKKVTKEDIFYYVYGLLHSPDYRTQFANDLKKMLPRIPLVDEPKSFWKLSNAGRELADLHIGYEEVPPAKEVMIHFDKMPQENINQALDSKKLEALNYRVEKMRFPKKGQKDTIIYNSQISITGIPDKAYEYVVNGKSAIEWIMERYQVTVHKDSGIKNDPNDWAEEVGKPRYILDLLLSVINVSLQTVDIVNDLPKLDFEAMAAE